MKCPIMLQELTNKKRKKSRKEKERSKKNESIAYNPVLTFILKCIFVVICSYLYEYFHDYKRYNFYFINKYIRHITLDLTNIFSHFNVHQIEEECVLQNHLSIIGNLGVLFVCLF